MRRVWAGAALVSAALWLLWLKAPEGNSAEAAIRLKLRAGTGIVELPAGTVEISSELSIPATARDLEIRGAARGTLLRASDSFRGRAIFRCEKAARVRFTGFTIDGNRQGLEYRRGLPDYRTPFARFTRANGILVLDVDQVTVSHVGFVNIAGFAILVSRSRGVTIDSVHVDDSGSRNPKGRNNTTGGILLEEGTEQFSVTRSVLRNVLGNGIWTHSLYTSLRNHDGRIADNRIDRIGRDAIQIGHAAGVRVERNTGSFVGFPAEIVDVEGGGMPVAIDTAGNTGASAYFHNSFEEINGKCIDLDGFHDGQVRGNTCINRQPALNYPFGHYGIVMNNSNPDMRPEGVDIQENQIDGALYGGIFVIGTGNHIVRNRLLRLNLAHCGGPTPGPGCNYAPNQPDLWRSGIYLGAGAERPALARSNVIEDNQISGFGMSTHCIMAAPGVSLTQNRIASNLCRDDAAE